MEEIQIDDETLLERKTYVEQLKAFISEHQNNISSLLQELSWTPEHFVKRQDSVVCPYCPGHVIPTASLKKHTELCQFTSKGCPKEEVHLQLLQGQRCSENSLFSPLHLDEDLINRIVWSNQKGQRNVPVSHEDLMVNFDTSERLQIQRYVSEQLKPANDVLNVEKDDFLSIDWQIVAKKGGLSKDKPKTKFEILNELRDLRRRRQTYRAKNVHITKKSYTEIMREVINNQINILAGGPGEYQEEVKKEKEEQAPVVGGASERKDIHPDQREVERGGRDRDRRDERDRSRRRDRSDDEDSRSGRRYRDREGRRRDRSSSRHRRSSRERSRSRVRHRSRESSSRSRRRVDGERSTRREVADGTGSEDIPDSELFSVKLDSESRVSSTGLEEEETDRDSCRSSRHKHKHKHKQKHKHKHKHRRQRESEGSN